MVKTKTSRTDPFKILSDYLVITLGLSLFVLSWCIFLRPWNMVSGGVTGISAIIDYATGFNMGICSGIINGILLLIAFFILGGGFGIKTIYAIIFSSLGLYFLPMVIPQSFIQELALDNGKMFSAIIGACMTGVAIAMTFTRGGSTGGTDIIALIINKYRAITPGRLLMVIDVVIILSSLFLPLHSASGELLSFSQKFANVVYGFVMVAVNGYTVDLYLTGSKQSVQIYIFTSRYQQMADMVTTELDRGVTLLHSEGWYFKKQSEVLMVIARKTDLNIILSAVKEVDPSAFVSVTSAMSVYGLGFDTIKSKSSPHKRVQGGKQRDGQNGAGGQDSPDAE